MGEQRRGGLGGSGEISAAALRASMGLTCGGEAAAAPQAATRRRDARAGPRPPATTAPQAAALRGAPRVAVAVAFSACRNMVAVR